MALQGANDMTHNVIIGTAGHVDHGKTWLIKALTGVDTDRLQEEKKRGITIELGFASLPNDEGLKIGIIDVPGHEKFVKNMLAGIGGIDLVLLIIGLDEGVMPQTREHFEILKMLHIKKGILVFTKADLADEDWCRMVEEDARELVKGSFLEDAPAVRVSAVTGQNIELPPQRAGAVPPSGGPGVHHGGLRNSGDRDPDGRFLCDRGRDHGLPGGTESPHPRHPES